jgi:hypothetical protein
MDGSPGKETEYPKTWSVGDIFPFASGENSSSGSSQEKLYGREEGELFFFRGPTHRINQPIRKPITKLTRTDRTVVVSNPQNRNFMLTGWAF